jgi:hypothetical protein
MAVVEQTCCHMASGWELCVWPVELDHCPYKCLLVCALKHDSCCDISLSWWCSCSFDGVEWCYLLFEWLCIWLLACIKVKQYMRGEREIRPKWSAIYTFLGRGKWWQKWWQMGWVITFPMTNCELFTSRPWLRLRSRLEAVLLLVAIISQICHPMTKIPQVCYPMALMPQW